MDDKQLEFIKSLGLNVEDFEPTPISQGDRIEAQVMYTALMTDTLLESEDVE